MYTIAPLNYLIAALLILAALASLAAGLHRRWLAIAHGRAGRGTAAINWPALISRALLQSRLHRRAVSGAAHGLLFFGALIEILGHGLFPLSFLGIAVYSGWFGRLFMEGGREVAGLMMAAGVAFLLARRLRPPERLVVPAARRGFVAPEALLLVIIVAGFGVEALRLTDPLSHSWGEFLGKALARSLAQADHAALAQGYRLVWWLHGLLGLAFIALIAHTPMSHMLLAPVNSALAPRRPGLALTPVDLESGADGADPVFGASKLADLDRKSLLDASACLGCGRCHEVCPAAQTGKPLSPKQVMLTCAAYLEQGRFEDTALLTDIGLQAIFDCTTCAACVEECPVSNSPVGAILEFRRHFVMERSELPETMAAANRQLERRGHPFVGTAANPDDWREGLAVPEFEAGTTEYLLWIGCAVKFEPRAQQVARAMVRVLEAAGVSFGVLRESRCTGDPARMMGNELQFLEMANANIEEFRELGVRRVITLCAHCFNSFDRHYRELGADWETIPHGVLIERLIRAGRLPGIENRGEAITFHDPCYLARHNGIVAETRSVVSAVGRLVEMPRHGLDSFCCGAGGGNYWGGQGGSARIGDVRAAQALATGATRIATSCPFCLLMLSAGTEREAPGRRVFDLAELVAEALPQPGSTAVQN